MWLIRCMGFVWNLTWELLVSHFTCLEKFIVTSDALLEGLRVLTLSSSPIYSPHPSVIEVKQCAVLKKTKNIISVFFSPLILISFSQ